MSDVSHVIPTVGTLIPLSENVEFQQSNSSFFLRIKLNKELDTWEISEDNTGFMVFLPSAEGAGQYLRVSRIVSSGKAAFGELVVLK